MVNPTKFFAVIGVACGLAFSVGSAVAAQKETGGATGGACHVISGANKGKSGTYNADGDCSGDWGISECKNQDGTDSGKCADGKAVKVDPGVLKAPTGNMQLQKKN